MPNIEQAGFLSPQITDWINKHRAEHSEWFALAEKVNAICQRLMLALEPPIDDEQKVLVALLFSRVLSHFQGVVLLIERGMVAEARSLLRGMLDATFAQVALSKHAELVKEFVDDDMSQRLKHVNCIRALPKELKKHHGFSEKELTKLADELKCEIDKRQIKPLRSEYLAQKAEMLTHYNTLFVMLSSSTHSRVRDMVRHLDLGESKEHHQFKWGPDAPNLDELVMPACDCLFVAARAASSLFACHSFDAELQESWDSYQGLAGKS